MNYAYGHTEKREMKVHIMHTEVLEHLLTSNDVNISLVKTWFELEIETQKDPLSP